MKGTIKSKKDIERLFQEGRRSSSYKLTVLTVPLIEGDSAKGRCAFIAGKKLGKAPKRSRSKRVLREAARVLGAPWNGHDVVFIAQRKTAKLSQSDLIKAMDKQLSELGVVVSDGDLRCR